MELKNYQLETLDVLRRFLAEARLLNDPKQAFETITNEPEQAKRLGRYLKPYEPVDGLPDVPYVCLRLPTGGGKTLLAAHSIEVARKNYLEKEYPVVLWLTPSDIIRQQTAEALKDVRHPYREALDQAFEGRVRVLDIADFAQLRPHDIGEHLIIVVGTLQTLRITKTDKRKVYSHNEDLEPHFTRIPSNAPGLERFDEGPSKDKVKFSFANLLYHLRPLLILDEAHKGGTKLSVEMKQRVNPSAIVEMTATPKGFSNILHSVSAQALKQEHMIKMPIALQEHPAWEAAVTAAIASRAALAEKAKLDTKYIRPIVLFQAEPKDREVTVEKLEAHLMDVHGIAKEKIARATGVDRELDGVDLFDPTSKVEYVITVQALKEGWDCSFAYVFCSLANISSQTDVEQLLGRVLRMPYAERRKAPELNKAYAHVSEPSFKKAADALVDKLIQMGFDEEDARDNVEAIQHGLDDDWALPRTAAETVKPVSHETNASEDLKTAVSEAAPNAITLRETETGKVNIEVYGLLTEEAEARIAEVLPGPERKAFQESISRHREEIRARQSPAEKGARVHVPALMAEVQGELELADTDIFIEAYPLDLVNVPSRFSEREFAIQRKGATFEIDLENSHIVYKQIEAGEQLNLDVAVDGWSEPGLIGWLDRSCRQHDLRQAELVGWLTKVVKHLLNERYFTLSELMQARFLLARVLKQRIANERLRLRKTAYQAHLFDPDAVPQVRDGDDFVFFEGMYSDVRRYGGRYRFGKHFLGPNNVPFIDGGEKGEEFQCAQALDTLAEIKYWVRNVSRHPNSFWLPTSTDRFYPDFVAELNDGRIFVVEYKGSHLATGEDAAEKEAVGKLWARSSHDKGVFGFVTKRGKDGEYAEQLKNLI